MSRIEADPWTPGTCIVLRGDTWTIDNRADHDDCTALRVVRRGSGMADRMRTFLLPFDRPRPVDRAPRPRCLERGRWLHVVRQLLAGTHPIGGLRTAAAAMIDLLPFQMEPALAMLRHGRLRLLIADEVGLGKTVQAALILSELSVQNQDFRAIVIAPAGLRDQWRSELSARLHLDSTFADTRWLAAVAGDLPPGVNPWTLPGIYVTSVDLAKRPEVLRAIENVTWDVLVVDEAHGLGMGTARLAAANAIGVRSRRVVLLTATPPDEEPAHFDALASIGRIDEDDGIIVFRRCRAEAGIEGRRKTVLLPVRLSRAERRMHSLLDRYTSLVWRESEVRGDSGARLVAIVLRKRALSSPRCLALSLHRRLALLCGRRAGEEQLLLPLSDEDPLPDAPPDEAIGAPGLADADRERALLSEIVDAADRAAASESKLAFLRRFLRRVSEPVIVFTEYRDTLAHIATFLGGGCAPLLLHGGLTPAERSRVQRSFDQSGTLLLATDAASEGLNLHRRCRTVVHFELPWMPMRLEQRTGRVDRLGQARTVHEVLLVARHTSERLVLAPLLKRARTAAAAGRRSGLMALTESAVAAAVVGSQPLPPACEQSTPPESAEFRKEAEDEAARATAIRRAGRAAAAISPPPPPGGVAVTFSACREPAVIALLRVYVQGGTGDTLHDELVFVTVGAAFRRLPRCPVDAVRVAEELMTFHAAPLAAAVAANAAAAEGRARSLLARLRLREASMAAALPSTATRMVQAGLFDRRGLIEVRARNESAAAVLSQSAARVAALDNERVRTCVRLAAVHVGCRFPP